MVSSVTRVGDFLHFGQLLKLFATMNLPKSPTFLGNFSKGAKIIDFSNEIIIGELLQTFGDFYLVTLAGINKQATQSVKNQYEEVAVSNPIKFRFFRSYLMSKMAFSVESELCSTVEQIKNYRLYQQRLLKTIANEKTY